MVGSCATGCSALTTESCRPPGPNGSDDVGNYDKSPYKQLGDLADKAFDKHEATVDDLHSRSGTTLSAAFLATSFFGAATITTGHNITPYQWAAFGTFAASSLSFLLVLIPHTWHFATDYQGTIDEYTNLGTQPTQREIDNFLLESVRGSRAHYEADASKLSRLQWLFLAGMILLISEILL